MVNFKTLHTELTHEEVEALVETLGSLTLESFPDDFSAKHCFKVYQRLKKNLNASSIKETLESE